MQEIQNCARTNLSSLSTRWKNKALFDKTNTIFLILIPGANLFAWLWAIFACAVNKLFIFMQLKAKNSNYIPGRKSSGEHCDHI